MSAARNTVRCITLIGFLVMAGSAGMFAHGWLHQIPLERLSISGATHASGDEVKHLAAVDSLSRLWSVEPELVADRIRRHPWVKDASVTRWPTGTLRIAITERRPTLLAVADNGSPTHFVDEEGYGMPLVPGVAYDVPLLRGLIEAPHPLRRASDERVLTLASDLASLSDEVRELLSEFELRDREVWMRTAATSHGASVPVRLGRDGFGEKIVRMHAFWRQAILSQPDRVFQLIDLRFDGQVVTRELDSNSPKNLN